MNSQFKKGFLHEYAPLLGFFTAVLDVVVIAAMHFFTMYANGIVQDKHTLFTLIFVIFVFLVTAQYLYFYHSHRTSSINSEIGQLLLIWLIAIGLLSALLFSFDKFFTQDPAVLKAWFIITPFLLVISRTSLRGFARLIRRMGRNFRYTAIVGATEMGLKIRSSIEGNAWMGMKFGGFFDQRNEERMDSCEKYSNELVFDTDKLFHLIGQDQIHIVYIALPMSSQKRIKELIDRLSTTNVSVYFAPDFYTFDLLHSRWDNLDGQPVISIVETPFLGNSNLLKRMQDLVFATAATAVLSIPLLIVAILIKSDSKGPVIYKQQRYGLDGKSFMIWKFRTMRDAPDSHVFAQAKQGDERITAMGYFLRRHSIDELPQIYNVLIGQMSIVGPRPHPIALDEEHQSMIRRYNLRFKVKPGITGWAQVNGFRGETDTIDKMEQRIQYDLEYIRNWSFLLDIKILLLTVYCVLKPMNAH